MLKPGLMLVLLASLQAFAPLSIDMYLPALPQVASDLGGDEAQIQLSVSSFLVGLFIGMLLYGPLSDKYGRRRFLLFGISLYAITCLGCMFASSPLHLIVWRLLQALGGAAAAVLGRAIVRDIFPVTEAARALSLMHLVTMIASLSAPVLGSYLMLVASWRWVFAVLLLYSLLVLLATFLKIPETHHGSSRNSSLAQVFLAYLSLLGQRVAIGYVFSMGLCFAGMFAFITASSFVYIDYFHLNPRQYALLFALNVVGIMILVITNARIVHRLGTQVILYATTLICALSGLVLITSAAFGYASLPLIVCCIFGHVSCTGVIGANCLASMLARYPDQSGAAAGLAIAAQFGLGAAASSLVSILFDGTPLYMSLIVGGSGIGCLLFLLLTRKVNQR